MGIVSLFLFVGGKDMSDKLTKRQYDDLNDIESWLYNYKKITATIENMILEYNTLDFSLSSKNNEGGATTNRFSSEVENAIARKDSLAARITILKNKKAQIDAALNALSPVERIVIEKFYIENQKYKDFIEIINYSEVQTKRIKKRAINKLVDIVLYKKCS